MKFSSRLSLSTILAIAASSLQAEVPPYLETAPVTILWNLNQTGTSGTTLGPVAVPVPDEGLPAIFDPAKLRPVDRITTETSKPISAEGGDQQFFVKHLLRDIMEDFAKQAKLVEERIVPLKEGIVALEEEIAALTAQIDGETDEGTKLELIDARTELETELSEQQDELADEKFELSYLDGTIFYLEERLEARWELTAVRAPQASIRDTSDEPYIIYLTLISVGSARPSTHFITPLFIEPLASVGNYAEILIADRVTKATGSITTHFSVAYSTFYADDPLYKIASGGKAGKVSGKDYNTKGTAWAMGSRGYMTCTVKTSKGPTPAITRSKISLTGIGTWGSAAVETEATFTSELSYGGIGALRMNIGEAKFQNNNLFPGFPSD